MPNFALTRSLSGIQVLDYTNTEFFTKVDDNSGLGGRDGGEEVAARMGLSRDIVSPMDEELPNRIGYFEKLGVVGKSLSNLEIPNG